MKTKNIPHNIKSKSIKEAKDEINTILSKLEKNDTDLESSMEDYQRLIKLNNHVDSMFKSKMKEVSRSVKSIRKKKNSKK